MTEPKENGDVENNKITGPMCEARNSMPLDELNSGMGDIFIRLAN